MSEHGIDDEALDEALKWAIRRMREHGYDIKSEVKIVVDPKLPFMGYTKEKDGVQYVVASEWALDSEMLGGFLIHELSHVYMTEKGLPSHDTSILEDVLEEYKEQQGLSEREISYLLDCFSHLQNIIADDIVFEVMTDREKRMAERFFQSWITKRPSGDPLVDASSLVRNAFAIASLKRRGLFRENSEMDLMNKEFLSFMKEKSRAGYNAVEKLFVNVKADQDEEEFKRLLKDYFELVISIARDRPQLEDIR